mmetsp:Transcript_14503/g.34491  ORF Transcript_14503/g.34491 Transcript_14503/m.34491 type:complete len:277 (+) Transcript_14503:549-1379(+)
MPCRGRPDDDRRRALRLALRHLRLLRPAPVQGARGHDLLLLPELLRVLFPGLNGTVRGNQRVHPPLGHRSDHPLRGSGHLPRRLRHHQGSAPPRRHDRPFPCSGRLDPLHLASRSQAASGPGGLGARLFARLHRLGGDRCLHHRPKLHEGCDLGPRCHVHLRLWLDARRVRRPDLQDLPRKGRSNLGHRGGRLCHGLCHPGRSFRNSSYPETPRVLAHPSHPRRGEGGDGEGAGGGSGGDGREGHVCAARPRASISLRQHAPGSARISAGRGGFGV